MSLSPQPEEGHTGPYPPGVRNYFVFSVLNTMTWSVVIGAPMLLYFKKLDASATILSIVGALPNLLNVLQIPAARFVEQVGYKRFVIVGWGLRSIFVLMMVGAALMPSGYDLATRITFMLFCLFGFCTLRGISVCGVLPWVTGIVPAKVRGRFVSTDKMLMNLTVAAMMVGVALYTRQCQEAWHFAPVFAVSFVAQVASVFVLLRVPDAKPAVSSRSVEPIPWGAMLGHRPFRYFLLYNAVAVGTFGTSAVFYIPLLRDLHAQTDSNILLINFCGVTTGVVSYYFFGKLLDHAGSRPFLATSNVILVLHFLGWSCVASGLLPLVWWSIIPVQMTAGLGVSFLMMANMRMAMAIVPEMGRSHFLALFSVVFSGSMGATPVVWGLIVDALGDWSVTTGFWTWNAYSLLYLILAVQVAVASVMAGFLCDKGAMTTDRFMEELLIKTPSRAITRLWRQRQVPQ